MGTVTAAGRLVGLSPSAATFSTLVQRATLAGDAAEVKRLLEEAAKALQGQDLESVRKAAEEPPKVTRGR